MTTPSLHARLHALAENLWWTWQPEVIAIFRDLDPRRWRAANHNPVAFLATFPPEELAERAEATALESRINFAVRRLQSYLVKERTWGRGACAVLRARPVAYFSAEFALHEALPLYSGGLGVLAGDHLKTASDLGVPLIGVGIFYAQGYFRQRLRADGWQEEEFGEVDVERLPLRRAVGPDGAPILVEVPLDGGRLRVGAWRAEVGRAALILLDSDVAGNSREQRVLTAHLYGGDARVRLRQELILGVGGVRMLDALGIRPGVLHLNEGHSALAPLEVTRRRAAATDTPFLDAHRDVALRTVFTTHTPVHAGHDWFAPDLVLEHLGWLCEAARITPEALLALGRVHPHDPHEPFGMSVLALRSARYANAVSALHGNVSRRMWQSLWPGRPEAEVPIGHITNGVHIASWIAPAMRNLADQYLGANWFHRLPESLAGLDGLDPAVGWEVHQLLKRQMLQFVLRRCRAQAEALGLGRETCGGRLEPDVLTIVFARRFAAYKRAELLLADIDRLARIVNAPGHPVQLIFAGKAHPHDDEGKRVLQRVVALTRDPRFRDRVAVVVDYDFSVARHLVQGADVWLNTPRRPLEACGTSGQKAVLNGGLNLSILDGWWAEAYDGENGFAIGDGGVHRDPAVQDQRDALDLYRVIEERVVPLYYERDDAGVPRRWVACVKHSIVTLTPRFNAYRMVRDYVQHCYLPAAGALSAAMPGAHRHTE